MLFKERISQDKFKTYILLISYYHLITLILVVVNKNCIDDKENPHFVIMQDLFTLHLSSGSDSVLIVHRELGTVFHLRVTKPQMSVHLLFLILFFSASSRYSFRR